MKDEINQGYVITDRIHVDPDNAFVLGFNPKAPQPFVTWKCGSNDYYYNGHYFNDPDKAIRDLCARVIEELDYKKERMILAEPVIGGHTARAKSKLPEQCYGTHQETGELILIKRFETGYIKSDWTTNAPEKNQRLADKLNRQAGITKAQRAAMEAGSMFGWDAFGANPDHYLENGQFKKVSTKVLRGDAMAKNTRGLRILSRLIDAGYDTEKAIAGMTLDDIIALEIVNKNDMAVLNGLIKSVKANRVVTFLASGPDPERKDVSSQNTALEGDENNEGTQTNPPHDPVC